MGPQHGIARETVERLIEGSAGSGGIPGPATGDDQIAPGRQIGGIAVDQLFELGGREQWLVAAERQKRAAQARQLRLRIEIDGFGEGLTSACEFAGIRAQAGDFRPRRGAAGIGRGGGGPEGFFVAEIAHPEPGEAAEGGQ